MTGRQRARRIVLALAVLAGCTDPPASPTPVPPADPVPSAVSVELDQTTARVGEVITFTYRMEPALDRPVDIWTDVTTPSGESHEGGPIDFPIGETTRIYSTGYIPESWIGTWTGRIKGERLTDGVVLGEPASYTFTVAP